jgi:hypothetical protein
MSKKEQLLVRLVKKRKGCLCDLSKNEQLLVRLVNEGTVACETCQRRNSCF